MHFHLPKPLHGWREFVGEIAIIVIGVLIALGAEQVVERIRWQEQGTQARDAIEAELAGQEADAYERLAVSPCLRSQITALSKGLSEYHGKWVAMPVVVNSSGIKEAAIKSMPTAYRAPERLWLHDAWETARASGALTHLPPDLVSRYSDAYNTGARIFALQESEEQAAARLGALAFDGDIDNSSRVALIGSLVQVDRDNSYIENRAISELETLREVLRGKNREARKSAVQARIAVQKKFRGSCVRQPLVQF